VNVSKGPNKEYTIDTFCYTKPTR